MEKMAQSILKRLHIAYFLGLSHVIYSFRRMTSRTRISDHSVPLRSVPSLPNASLWNRT